MEARTLVTVLLVVIGVLVLLPILGMSLGGFAGWQMGPGMMGPGMGPGMMGRGFGSGFGFPGFGLLSLLFLIGGIVLIVLAFSSRQAGTGTGPGTGTDEALQVLRRRLASGEITREQYEDLRQALQ